MNKDFYIRLRDNKSIILDDYNDGMSLSVHIIVRIMGIEPGN